jgi:hypothetical protein
VALTQCPDCAPCIAIHRTAFVQLPCTQTTKENHGSRNWKEITHQGSARLDFLTMPPECEHEQVLYAPIPHRNAEKLALSFYMGNHEPYKCTFQHGHAAILSRAQGQPTSTNKSIDCLPGPFFIQGFLDAFVGRGNWSGAWRGKRKRRSIDLRNCRGGSVGFTRGDKSEKMHFIGGSNAQVNGFYVYIFRGDKGRKVREKICIPCVCVAGRARLLASTSLVNDSGSLI